MMRCSCHVPHAFKFSNTLYVRCNAAARRQLPESVVEIDVCSLVLSVDVWIDKTFFDEGETARVFLTEDQIQSQTLPMVSNSLNVDEPQLEGRRFGAFPDKSLAAMEVDHASFNSANASAARQMEAMPEMLRVKSCLER